MAHKLPLIIPKRTGPRKFSLPDMSGKFGFSFYLGSKELFVGFSISEVILEKIYKRRVVKISPAKVRTFGFDPFDQTGEENIEG